LSSTRDEDNDEADVVVVTLAAAAASSSAQPLGGVSGNQGGRGRAVVDVVSSEKTTFNKLSTKISGIVYLKRKN
jgi:inorganic pyrophosphatase